MTAVNALPTITAATALRVLAGGAALTAGTVGTYMAVKKGYIYAHELPKAEVVARTDGVIIERPRPTDLTGAVRVIPIGLGVLTGIAGWRLLSHSPSGAGKLIGAGLVGLGIGAIAGASAAASLFIGASARLIESGQEQPAPNSARPPVTPATPGTDNAQPPAAPATPPGE